MQAFLEVFPQEQILLLESEALRAEPARAMQQIADFLGIPPEFDAEVLRNRYHQSSDKKRPTNFEVVLRERFRNPLLLAGIRTFSKPFREQLERPVLTSSDQEFLFETFEPEVRGIRALSGQAFDRWSL